MYICVQCPKYQELFSWTLPHSEKLQQKRREKKKTNYISDGACKVEVKLNLIKR